MAIQYQHQVVIVGQIFGARSINQSLNRRRIGTIIWSGRDSRRIGAIGWSMDRRRIGAIIQSVRLQAQHSRCLIGQQYGTSDRVIFQGAKLYLVMFRSQAYWHNSNRDHRHISTISQSVVNYMHIGTISCLIHRSQAFGDAYNYITLVHTFHHQQFFLCAYSTVGRQLSHSQVTGVWGRI